MTIQPLKELRGAEGAEAHTATLGSPPTNPDTKSNPGLVSCANVFSVRFRMLLLAFTWSRGGAAALGLVGHAYKDNIRSIKGWPCAAALCFLGGGAKRRDEFPRLRSIRHIFPFLY